ncbi:MAG: hypothetical protein JXR68_03165 [Bacteroidales bacterium]|nr:hypothetical protein [Bacteroidales bacterium]
MKKIIYIIALLFISISVFGQGNSLYFNKNLYQSTYLNPARQVKCKFILGLPGLSSEFVTLKNTGIGYNDIFFEYESLADSFHYDPDATYDRMNELNYIFLNTRTALWTTAFWIRGVQISFDASLRTETNFAYPQSIFLLKDGNFFTDGRFISATNMAVNTSAYTEVSIGASGEVAQGLTIGGKFKVLRGIVNFNTEQFMFDWHVSDDPADIYDYSFNTSFNFNTTAPLNVIYDDQGNITSAELDSTLIQDIQDDPLLLRDITTNNPGFGVDFGVIYNLNNKFEFSASVLDLGFIKWKATPTNITTNESEFVFSGLDVGKYIGTLGLFTALKDTDTRDSIIGLVTEDFIDSLLFLSDPTITNNEYKTSLNTKLNFGAAYMPKDWVTLGFLYNGVFFNKKLYSSYTLSSTLMFWRGWSYSLSYTMSKKSMNNVGMGFSYKVGPLQMFLTMDNFSLPMMGARYGLSPDKPYDKGIATKWLKNTDYLNVNFGLNFVFGCRDKTDYGLLD